MILVYRWLIKNLDLFWLNEIWYKLRSKFPFVSAGNSGPRSSHNTTPSFSISCRLWKNPPLLQEGEFIPSLKKVFVMSKRKRRKFNKIESS